MSSLFIVAPAMFGNERGVNGRPGCCARKAPYMASSSPRRVRSRFRKRIRNEDVFFSFVSLPHKSKCEVSTRSSQENPSQTQSNPNADFSILPTGYKLNGQNYNLWSHSVSIFIGGKGKEEYLSDDLVQPEEKSPEFKRWKAENNMVMSWLLNTMIPKIGEQFMFYKTASEIWEAARDTFSNQENTSALFEIKGILHNLRQGDLTVTSYFTSLNRYWQQLDVLDTLTWSCSADGKQYKRIPETERIYKFLLGLNQELDEVRGRILGMKPMPSLREVFSEVRREESRRRVMLGVSGHPVTEGSALATRFPSNPKSGTGPSQKKTGRPWCDHCKRPGHTKETCWKIHGKPADWKPSSRGNLATSENLEPFTKEQLEALRKVLQSTTLEDKGIAAIAQQGGGFSSAFTTSTSGTRPWVVDCGATDHMTGDRNTFAEFQPMSEGKTIKVATGEDANVAGIGTVVISKNITLRSVLYVPNLDYNLLAPIKLMKDLNCITVLTPSVCVFQALNSRKMIGSAKVRDELYHCEAEKSGNRQISSSFNGPSRVKNVSGARWFVTFIDDHTRVTWVFLMKDKSEVGPLFQQFHKMVQTQFSTKIRVLKSDNAKEYFHSELGNYLTQQGIVHITSCVNTPQQNGVAERKNRHLLEVTRSLLFSSSVPNYFWGEAVLTAAYLINRMPSRVIDFKTPHQTLRSFFPHIRTFSEVPLKIFGCTSFVHNHQPNHSKLDPRSVKCVLLGYSPNQCGYKCYSPSTKFFYHSMDVTFFEEEPYYSKTDIQGESSMEYQFLVYPNQNPLESNQNTEIHSSTPIPVVYPNQNPLESNQNTEVPNTYVPTPSPSDEIDKDAQNDYIVYTRRPKQHVVVEPVTTATHNHESSPNSQGNTQYTPGSYVHSDDSDLNVPIALRKGKRSCTAHPISNFVSYDKLSPKYKKFALSVSEIQVPKNIQEATSDKRWADAVNEEIKALQENNTWECTHLPQGKRTVGCKWVFTVKYNSDGSVNRYKARLVAKGYTQSYGIDYAETFAPVAKLNYIRVLLSLAANLDRPLHQLDVKNAFLNGELEEEVYMDIPQGLESQENNGMGQADHTMFTKHSSDGQVAIMIVYVDDIIITGNYTKQIDELKQVLGTEFKIKDLGQLRYFLGMEIARSRKGALSESQCADAVRP
ncbi:hypothetical protein LXL04_032504 [Taraxacum kok-saghyz]